MRRSLSAAAGCLLLLVTGWSHTAHAQAVDPFAWQVEQRFRLWDGAQAGPGKIGTDELLGQIAGPVSPEDVHDKTRAFLLQQKNLYRAAHWNAAAEQYDASYIFPTSYVVQIGLADAAAHAGKRCTWTTSIGAVRSGAVSCDKSVRLVLPVATDASGSRAATVTVQPDGAGDLPVTGEVRVRDRLIAGIGDSFASGEGNPDRPSDFGMLTSGLQGRWEADWGAERWLGRGPAVEGFVSADWWDPRCHRSFHSQQVVAALKYAADHPHEATTFVSFACSGAHVLNGLLTVQAQPPGYRDSSTALELQLPQVEALLRNLCRPGTAGDGGLATYKTIVIAPNGVRTPVIKTATKARCADERARRKVDVLMVSIGGNDVGFSPVIFDGLLPTHVSGFLGETMLKLVRGGERTRLPGVAYGYIQYALPDALTDLGKRLGAAFPEAHQTLQTEYPSPTKSEVGILCGAPNEDVAGARGHLHLSRLAAISGVWPDQNVPPPERWRLSIDQREGKSVESQVVRPLNETIAGFDAEVNWTYVTGYAPAFERRGWCATSGTDQAEFPAWSQTQNRWATWNPGTWDPYVRRARMFRTPNDTALTESVARPRRIIPINNPWFSERQEGLLASQAGAFHPSYEGHVIMGLTLAQNIRPVN